VKGFLRGDDDEVPSNLWLLGAVAVSCVATNWGHREPTPLCTVVWWIDIYVQWQTTWDRNILFTHFQPTPEPINFVTPGVIGSADIVIDDSSVYQTVYGFGASLSKLCRRFSGPSVDDIVPADSSVELLNNLKVCQFRSLYAVY
jgi:hypothetical protein